VTARAIEPLSLAGRHIGLRPLREDDGERLVRAASDGELWNLKFTIVPSSATVTAYIAAALAERDAGTAMPLVTEDLATGSAIGSTRFWKVDRRNRKCEIGHTWLSASWQRTHANTESKYLMLRHAFEAWNCIRVQFTTDEINEKSRQAILRLGAREEGIIRNERIMPDGRKRNSVRYSIIDEEWPRVRTALEERLARLAPA
jgi:RimJ/RimL family protein N-acetyltransferase